MSTVRGREQRPVSQGTPRIWPESKNDSASTEDESRRLHPNRVGADIIEDPRVQLPQHVPEARTVSIVDGSPLPPTDPQILHDKLLTRLIELENEVKRWSKRISRNADQILMNADQIMILRTKTKNMPDFSPAPAGVGNLRI